MFYRIARTSLALLLGVILMTPKVTEAGDINPPPGPVAPTMKTLAEVEPRTPVQSLPGSATALYVISQPGSYYFAADVLGVAAKNGIEISSNAVSVDLKGFALRGVPGSNNGIVVNSGTDVSIHGGIIRDWGLAGINADSRRNQHYNNLRISGNSGLGVKVGIYSKLESIVAYQNGSIGITAEASSLNACVSSFNGSAGFSTLRCSLANCVATDNTSYGFDCSDSVLADCGSYSNDLHGFLVSGGMLRHCVSERNARHGIQIQSGRGIVVECTCEGNGQAITDGCGILVGSADFRVDGNSAGGNDRGIEATANAIIVRNNAGGNGTDYVNVTGTGSGPIATPSTATSPWANLRR